MQVEEEPGFYGASLDLTDARGIYICELTSMSVPTPSDKKKENEYAHVGSLDGNDVAYSLFPTASKRYGSYIVRAPPSARRVSRHANVESAQAARLEAERKLSGPQGDTRRVVTLDPLVEESLERTLSQQKRLSCIVTPTKAQSRPNPDSPSSASRQRRNLSRFTKELERYCVAASTNGRVPLPPSTPTVSESPTTLDTVTEFMPYHKQFRAAGLAVTSREQMPRIPESAHPQVPAKHAGRTRGINVTRVQQVDGSTVTPSGQEISTRDPEAPVVPDKEDAHRACYGPDIPRPQPQPTVDAHEACYGPDTPRPQPQPTVDAHETCYAPETPQPKPQPKIDAHEACYGPERPLADQAPKSTTKSLLPWFLRKNSNVASKGHSDRKVSKDHMHPSGATPAEDEQPAEGGASLSSRVSSTATDKPLPSHPSLKRRPVPPRCERRHMDNTAHWPTAGVLIHDDTPPAPNHDDSADSSDNEPPPAKDSRSVHSWTTIEDELPDEPQKTPPAPPKEPSLEEPEPQEQRRHHPGHSICNKFHKATSKRHHSVSKPLPVSNTIREESETPVDGPEKHPTDDAAPRWPVEFPFPVETSSSFERALDAVISKLDAMEERRRYERQMDLEAAHRAVIKSEPPGKTKSKATSLKPSSAPRSEHAASAAAIEAVPSSEEAPESSDKDIKDRDILVGLKMAICAACDEDLDAWICSKTGLRLRRFLADLKAFESVSQERKPPVPTPISRRIRRSGRENRRLQVEQERRKTKRWSQCFGADGQASVDEPSVDEAQAQPLEAAEE